MAEMGRSGPPTLEFRLEGRRTTIPLSGGREVPFTDAVLCLRNASAAHVGGVRARLTVHQEETLLYDGEEVLEAALPPGGGVAPGEEITWDLFPLFQEADRGFASKVHLFGLKAALNWRFRLRATAAFGEGVGQTAPWEGAFRWVPAEGGGDEVVLEILEP